VDDEMLPHGPDGLEAHRGAERHDEQRPLAPRPHVGRRRKEDQDAGEHVRQLEHAEYPRLKRHDREPRVGEVKQHDPQAARPEQAAVPAAAARPAAEEEAERQHLDQRDLDSARGAPVPRHAEEIDVHPLREHGEAHHGKEEQVADPAKPGRRNHADHREKRDHRERHDVLLCHGVSPVADRIVFLTVFGQ
jgi:hypothetical protein